MSTELLAMMGGSASGFIFKFMSTLAANQQANLDALLKKQKATDESQNQAAKRGGEWVRRLIVVTVLFGVIVAPFILAHSPEGVTVGSSKEYLFGLLNSTNYETLSGYVILPEIRQTVLAIVGFYFGSSTVK
tara:strand:- start:258 stop:653 length:396 start_codon:yes stop_codon:yes gene_type:complete